MLVRFLLKLLPQRSSIATILVCTLLAYLCSVFGEIFGSQAPCDLCLISRSGCLLITYISGVLLSKDGFKVWSGLLLVGSVPIVLHGDMLIPPVMIAVVLMLVFLSKTNPAHLSRLLLICVFAAFCFAFYHLGVENHWWAGPDKCTIDLLPHLGDDSPGDARTGADSTDLGLNNPPRCDVANWKIFGLSSTLYNFCLMAALFWLNSFSWLIEALQRRRLL